MEWKNGRMLTKTGAEEVDLLPEQQVFNRELRNCDTTVRVRVCDTASPVNSGCGERQSYLETREMLLRPRVV